MLRTLKSPRRLAALAVFAIVAMSAFGFAAANTVPDSKAGDDSGTITGYTISGIDYVLNAVDPGLVDTVEFDLDAAADTVVIQFDSPGTIWTCSVDGSNHATCDVSPGGTVTVLGINSLRVVAAD